MAFDDRSSKVDGSLPGARRTTPLIRAHGHHLLTSRRRRWLGLEQVVATIVLACWGAPACGGDVGYTFAETGGGGGDDGTGGRWPVGIGGTASGGNPFIGTGGQVVGVGGTLPYDEEQCPYVPPPYTVHECDPFNAEANCYYFEACLPYIVYPSSEDGCGTPGYGEMCVYAGVGEQGALCSSSGTGCSPGFMCVVGAAGGERCARICVPGKTDSCPGGLICGETDVLGYGVCY